MRRFLPSDSALKRYELTILMAKIRYDLAPTRYQLAIQKGENRFDFVKKGNQK